MKPIIQTLQSIPGPQILFGFIYIFCCGLWNSTLQIFVDHVTYYRQWHASKLITMQREALPDLGFDLCPKIGREHLADDIEAAILGITVASALFHSKRWSIMRRFFILQGTIFFLRGCTISITLLPNPFQACKPLPDRDENYMWEGLKIMGGQRITCGDVLFSGHSATMVLCCQFWFHYMPRDIPPRVRTILLWCMFLATLAGVLSCVCTKFHYSVDVFVATLLSISVFSIYHLVIRMQDFLDRKEWYCRLLAWYEFELYHKLNKYSSYDVPDQDSQPPSRNNARSFNKAQVQLIGLQSVIEDNSSMFGDDTVTGAMTPRSNLTDEDRV